MLVSLVHPVSKTHSATRRRQPSLLTAICSAASQVMPMLFKSCCMVYIQFFRGLSAFLFELLKWFPVYSLYVLAVCCRPFAERARAISVFSLLWCDLSSPVVSAPWPSCYWLCLSMRCQSFFFGTCDVRQTGKVKWLCIQQHVENVSCIGVHCQSRKC